MRYLLSLSLVVLYAFIANARQITPDEALTAAQDFLNNSSVEQSRAPRAVRARSHKNAQSEGGAPYYIFNASDNSGFVIISGDDRTKKILGYSDKGNFDMTNMPPQLSTMLDHYAKSLSKLSGSATDQSWTAPKHAANSDGGVLLETANWGQGYPYNTQCPIIEGVQAPTGCVATAMAIVMRYNQWPLKVNGEHIVWKSDLKPEYSFDYDMSNLFFDYSLMPSQVNVSTITEIEIQEISKIMSAAGASIRMWYDKEASASTDNMVGHCLNYYFDYSPDCQYVMRLNMSDEEWLSIIYDQLNTKHPIILTGINLTKGGHAFVCDGYSNDGTLHINWGWDGYSNGYYDPILLNGFSEDIGMIFNIKINETGQSSPRCWIDYGYYDTFAGNGPGLVVTETDITNETVFTARANHINMPKDFNGEVGIALVNKNNSIIEFLSEPASIHFYDAIDYDKFKNWIVQDGIWACDAQIKTPLTSEMRLQVVAREGSDPWRVVNGTIVAPSSAELTGNKQYSSKIKLNIHDPHSLIQTIQHKGLVLSPTEVTNLNLLLSDSYDLHVNPKGGVAYVKVNGHFVGNSSEYALYYNAIMAYVTCKDTYDIDIYCNAFSELLDKEITTTSPGTLYSYISELEQPLIHRLRISGPIDVTDFNYISSNLCSLRHLDLSNASIKRNGYNRENYLPEFAFRSFEMYDNGLGEIGICGPTLESLKLPKNLIGIEYFGLNYDGDILELPLTFSDYQMFSAIGNWGALIVNNPIPADISLDESFNFDSRRNTLLVVPSDSKGLYESHSSWRGFREIIEINNPVVSEYVTDDHFRYCIVTDFAMVTNQRGFYPLVLPHTVNHNGVNYPVKYLGNNYPGGIIVITNNEYYNLQNYYNFCGPLITASTIPNFTEIDKYSYVAVPGGCKQNFSMYENAHEMWKYEINTDNSALMITPYNDPQIVINSILINGVDAICIDENIYGLNEKVYALTSRDEIKDVIIQFSIDVKDDNGSILDENMVLTTLYSQEFNQNVPRSDFANISEIGIVELNQPISLFNLQGIKVFQGNTSDMPTLPSGIYLKQTGDKVGKFVIR